MAATKLRIYQDALRHLADARLAVITDDVESRYALDDAWAEAVDFVLRQAAWRFALKTEVLVAAAGPLPGFSNAYARPTDWMRTHALFALSGATEHPIDIREQGAKFSANLTTGIIIRYVSSTFADPALASNPWPEHFAQLVAAYLAFLVANRITGERSATGRMSELFSSLLGAAVALDAVSEDSWLRHQLDGSFRRAAEAVVVRGFWRKHLKTVQIEAQLVTPAMVGLPYRFALPADHLLTQALYVPWDGEEQPFNIRETAEDWSTDTPIFVARYLSTDALNSVNWPEPLAKAVLAYLDWQAEPASEASDKAAQIRAPAYVKLLDDTLRLYAVRESPWLRFQLNGSYQDAVKVVVERGRYRFAIRTVTLEPNADPTALGDGTVSPGYTYRFLRPNDHLRTIWVYHALATGSPEARLDIDFRDELDGFHTDHTPIRLRYITRGALDATQWPRNFGAAVMAWCEYVEARSDPEKTGVAVRKLEFFKDQVETAEALDDVREVPRVNTRGRFVAARYGGRGHGGAGGGATPSSTTILTGDDGDTLLSDDGDTLLADDGDTLLADE